MAVEQGTQNSTVSLTLSPEVSDYFDTLRDRVLSLLGERRDTGHALTVTSCRSGEGVSAVALNFALALSKTNEHGSVLLCDANLDSPIVHKVFQVGQGPGFSDVLAGKFDLETAIRATGIQRLEILPAGGGDIGLSGMVDSPRMGPFLTTVKERYRVVVFDAAPVLECSATARLAAVSDGTILTIEAERQRWEVAQRATDVLTDAGARILGAVLNKRRYHIPDFLYRRL